MARRVRIRGPLEVIPACPENVAHIMFADFTVSSTQDQPHNPSVDGCSSSKPDQNFFTLGGIFGGRQSDGAYHIQSSSLIFGITPVYHATSMPFQQRPVLLPRTRSEFARREKKRRFRIDRRESAAWSQVPQTLLA